ncbi:bifunctional methylenetetrahydrofolate dehydrogenase/methenyltetrahydrofolate cyclohydrolase FolD [Pediococcus acidilactici]|uniref:bifunctional methylenetetrahydrofolate dehydrogenase/methenyltetrahydrofolate cyclohydrolase FolD n=1 Tax=Pediococcus acidilactici TaxID=1254 RepID=UPI00132805FD|nr:bifunctional methylenetetrahydrofolate dehydrogenase/methenyltetrahydrofolate cyclohydrolase FolD [Pediococcus acidilactici]KAF0335979.1 bifunctional methylenetetrahydrofolate dehydrogenase/methenyltetrahydrofolate cyclohydrolase FolD [Pediococcus acidilactici]KAF0345653.1 bifunctional methylenetetrahydrofolate dehydrogenase/methenyltetrahydrofolate cyclohydrolase FolD [Pediococcus acidilactici]KAF0353777.1 bifunctional methylenetetrahydrofolate dehydrogenase/methenyltetrahydrofolate cyclohyd
MGQIIDGKALAAEIDLQTKAEVMQLKERGIVPHLAVVLVGDDPASHIYVRNKKRRAEKLRIQSTVCQFPSSVTEATLLKEIDRLNHDASVHAILVQMPLPPQIDEFKVTLAIDPRKDADGFHPVNMGRLLQNKTDRTPVACTPRGIMQMLHKYNINPEGKKAVVIGRSMIVGKPMAALLLNANATVTVAHSHTKNLSELTKQADILVVATGIAHFIKADQVKDGAVVIDVGMNRDQNGKLTGDVDFAEVSPKASFITPVPKGVGPMTITMLMRQTTDLTKWSI